MAARKLWAPDRRDMIWIDCNPQAGREMKDIQPLPVLSPKDFNERTGIVIGLPMTTAAFDETNPFAVKFRALEGRRATFSVTSRNRSTGGPGKPSPTAGSKFRKTCSLAHVRR
jgi:hypothetical protein